MSLTVHIHPEYTWHCGSRSGMITTDSRQVTCPVCLERSQPPAAPVGGPDGRWYFPRAIFADHNGIVGQADHIYSEALEIMRSVLQPDIHHTASEVMDCLHSCETALRILEEKYGVDLDDIADYVRAKNRARGYYGNQA